MAQPPQPDFLSVCLAQVGTLFTRSFRSLASLTIFQSLVTMLLFLAWGVTLFVSLESKIGLGTLAVSVQNGGYVPPSVWFIAGGGLLALFLSVELLRWHCLLTQHLLLRARSHGQSDSWWSLFWGQSAAYLRRYGWLLGAQLLFSLLPALVFMALMGGGLFTLHQRDLITFDPLTAELSHQLSSQHILLLGLATLLLYFLLRAVLAPLRLWVPALVTLPASTPPRQIIRTVWQHFRPRLGVIIPLLLLLELTYLTYLGLSLFLVFPWADAQYSDFISLSVSFTDTLLHLLLWGPLNLILPFVCWRAVTQHR